MAYARRCSSCGTNWPYLTAYNDCPICDQPTWFLSDGTHDDILTQLEAQQLVARHADELKAHADNERRMDRAFHEAFCRDNGIVDPYERVAVRADGAPLCELMNVYGAPPD